MKASVGAVGIKKEERFQLCLLGSLRLPKIGLKLLGI